MLSVGDCNLYVHQRPKSTDWHIAHLKIEPIGDATQYKKLHKHCRVRKRIACIEIFNSTKLYLVVPELRDNVVGLRELNIQSSKIYGVLLYKH